LNVALRSLRDEPISERRNALAVAVLPLARVAADDGAWTNSPRASELAPISGAFSSLPSRSPTARSSSLFLRQIGWLVAAAESDAVFGATGSHLTLLHPRSCFLTAGRDAEPVALSSAPAGRARRGARCSWIASTEGSAIRYNGVPADTKDALAAADHAARPRAGLGRRSCWLAGADRFLRSQRQRARDRFPRRISLISHCRGHATGSWVIPPTRARRRCWPREKPPIALTASDRTAGAHQNPLDGARAHLPVLRNGLLLRAPSRSTPASTASRVHDLSTWAWSVRPIAPAAIFWPPAETVRKPHRQTLAI